MKNGIHIRNLAGMAVLLAATFCSSELLAADSEKFPFRFQTEHGDKRTYNFIIRSEVERDGKQRVLRDIDTDAEILVRYVGDKDKEHVINFALTRMKFTFDWGPRIDSEAPTHHDSSRPKGSKENDSALADYVLTHPVAYTVMPNGKVTYSQLMNTGFELESSKLANAGKGNATFGFMEQSAIEHQMRFYLELFMFVKSPSEPVGVGDSWKADIDLKEFGFPKDKGPKEVSYKLKSVDKGLATVELAVPSSGKEAPGINATLVVDVKTGWLKQLESVTKSESPKGTHTVRITTKE